MQEFNFNQHITQLLKADNRLVDEENDIQINVLRDLVNNLDSQLIELLIADEKVRDKFFIQVKDVYVFKQNDFIFYLDSKVLDGSYTQYANRIGLASGGKFLTDSTDYVLDFPYKDCVLEGGQSTEEGNDVYFEYDADANDYVEKTAKRKEIFYNNIIAKDEIDRLLEPKAFQKVVRYDANGETIPTSFTRDAELNRQRGLPEDTITDNLIIKGNNLLALHSLEKEFKGKVKLIYIDPPYNTGNDSFAYNDKFNHSAWLTFMYNRLKKAKELLSDEGIICVHCDNNEQSYLKSLLDEIFNSSNFIETITVVNNPRGRDYGFLANMHEFIHLYSLNKEFTRMYKLEDFDKKFAFEDNISGYDIRELRNRNTAFHDKNRPNLCYPFYVNPQNEIDNGFLEISLEPKNGFIEVMPAKSNGIQTVWRWGKEKSLKNLNVNIVGKKMQEEGRYMIVEKYRENKVLPRSVWWDKDVNSEKGTVHLRELFDSKVFNFPKPETMITRILQISTDVNDIVLDYHLGSGTTASTAHKMNRQYIGIEQMNYIEDVAVERLNKVIGGEQGGISKAQNWQGGGSFVYAELAKNNETAKERIDACNSLEELVQLFEELNTRYFLDYNVRIKDFKENVVKEEAFINLSLARQKVIFKRMLDNNQLYVNLSEVEDARYNLSEDAIRLTKDFYQIKN